MQIIQIIGSLFIVVGFLICAVSGLGILTSGDPVPSLLGLNAGLLMILIGSVNIAVAELSSKLDRLNPESHKRAEDARRLAQERQRQQREHERQKTTEREQRKQKARDVRQPFKADADFLRDLADDG